MSLYDKSSLVMIPSGKKDGTVFSQKPVDGSGDFTFSRGSNLAATRVGADGLIEKGRENLLLYSNQFDTTWVKAASATLTSGQSGYNGSSDAWLLTKGNLYSNIYQNLSQGNVCTFSFYAKANTYSWLMLHIEDSAGDAIVSFNLNDGSIGGQIKNISASTESLGNGWYRCSITALKNATQFRIYPNETDWYSGASGSIYIQDAQVEIGLAATDYIESGATTGKAGLLEDEPRFDYSGGATCPSLLLEPLRTQLIGQTEYFGIWTNVSSNPVDVVNNFAISPEGVQNASKLTFNGANSWKASPSMNLTQQTYTGSVYMRVEDGGGDISVFLSIYATGTGAVRQDVPITITSEWQRFEAVFDNWTIGTGSTYFVIRSNTDGRSCLAYGAQFEAGSYPTSYIPNHSDGTITRGDDDMNLLNFQSNNLFSVDSGFIFYEFESIDDLFVGWTSSQSKDRFQYYDIDGFAGGYFRFRGYESNISLQVVNLGASPSSLIIPDGSKKVCISWNASSFSLFADGSKIGTMTTTSSIAVNSISNYQGNLGNKEALMKKMLWGSQNLSDADCITLTTI